MHSKFLYVSVITFLPLIFFNISCEKELELLHPKNNISFQTYLSDYHIFRNNLADLKPEDEFKEYTLATTLFTDYAEKQRLIKLPPGTRLKENTDGLPDFPDGTILVKTFFYYYDKRNPTMGKKIIETRLLILDAGKWNVATYVWNASQTEAILEQSGSTQTVNWINDEGKQVSINYHIPNLNECATCHNSDDKVLPIGFKLRNLNINVTRNGNEINQLHSMMQSGLLDPFDYNSITAVVNWQDNNQPLAKRARAYLDINCAHCHNPSGFASAEGMDLGYTVPSADTHIADKKQEIMEKMESGEMPKLGTTVVDEQALSIIKKYLSTL